MMTEAHRGTEDPPGPGRREPGLRVRGPRATGGTGGLPGVDMMPLRYMMNNVLYL